VITLSGHLCPQQISQVKTNFQKTKCTNENLGQYVMLTSHGTLWKENVETIAGVV